MRGKLPLNGCDYLMLGFDHELRRHGYAGNSCQIDLQLDRAIVPETLRERVAVLLQRHPILRARPGGWFMPTWKLPNELSADAAAGYVRTHRAAPGLREKLCDRSLDLKRGELFRFDLIEQPAGRMDVVFTWAHTLMDANSAEHFVALVGREDLPLPALVPPPSNRPPKKFGEKFRLGRKSVLQLDEYIKAQPRTVGVRFPIAPKVQRFRVERFTAEETVQVRALGAKLCGAFGGAQFHAAAAMIELHQLHQRVGRPSASYVLPVPVSLRAKGSFEPLFCNQVTMMMTQFLPEHLDSTAQAVAALKPQIAQAMRDGLIDAAVAIAEISRGLPLPVYLFLLKSGLRGEICSFFYGDVAAVTPTLTTFCGATVEEFTHIGATTPSPGIGAIFYSFRGQLRITVFYLETHFTAAEAESFATGLRARLLNP
jgi:hypothetical protein